MLNKTTKRGFTIVELLIAIVVIAILASITIVTFRSIQGKTYDAKMAAGFNQYGKLLEMEYQQNGQFPFGYDSTYGSGYVCLGKKDHYPAVDGWEEGACFGQKQSDGSVTTQAATFDSLTSSLLTHTSSLPDVSYKPVDIGGGSSGQLVRGPFYYSAHPQQYMILYYANYSGAGGGKACMWGGSLHQYSQYDMEACNINVSRI